MRFLSGTEKADKLTEAKISELDALTNHFSPRENLAIEYAERMALDHQNIDDELFDRLHKAFSDQQILELGMMIGQFSGVGRLLAVMDLEPKVSEI